MQHESTGGVVISDDMTKRAGRIRQNDPFLPFLVRQESLASLWPRNGQVRSCHNISHHNRCVDN